MRRAKSGAQIDAPGAIYARYSSHNQKDLSIEQQVAQAMALASDRGIRIVETYADRAMTGKTDKRPDFQRMMKDAALDRFRFVIAWKSNRIGRNMMEALINEARLREHGVRIIYVEEDFDDTAAGRFAARSMMNVNQFYSENMAEDIRRGLEDNAVNCKVTNGHLPFGYVADETLHYAIDEQRANAVREIYARTAAGDSFVDIAQDLNSRGIKTSNGKPWGKSSFWTILHNERYRGVYIYDHIRVEDGIPRIISDELFFHVQEVLKTKKNAQGRHRVSGDYALTGKLFCGLCKSPMVGISGRGKSGKLCHYYCCTKKRRERSCDKKNVRRDELELLVSQAIRDHILNDEIIGWIADKTEQHNRRVQENSHVAALEDQLTEKKRSIKNVMAAIEQGIITETTKGRLVELETERSELEGQIAAAKAEIIVISRDQIVETLNDFRSGDIDDPAFRSALFDTFLTAVFVYDDHLRIVFSFAGDKNAKDIAIDIDPPDGDASDQVGKCLYNLPSAPPDESQTNTPRLYETQGVFVLVLPFCSHK